jgi:hypothetical protein
MHFSISALMGFIAIAAVGLVGLREGTEAWAGITFSLTVIILLMAIPYVIYSRQAERSVWVGFTLFGWVYFYFAFSSWSGASPGVPSLPTSWLLSAVHTQIHAEPQYIPNPNLQGATIPMSIPLIQAPYIVKPGTTFWTGSEVHYRQVSHCLLALVFGVLGAAWFRLVYSFQARRRPADVAVGDSCESFSATPAARPRV